MGSRDESTAERTLYEQEGWGGDDGPSFSRPLVFTATAAFGIEWVICNYLLHGCSTVGAPSCSGSAPRATRTAAS